MEMFIILVWPVHTIYKYHTILPYPIHMYTQNHYNNNKECEVSIVDVDIAANESAWDPHGRSKEEGKKWEKYLEIGLVASKNWMKPRDLTLSLCLLGLAWMGEQDSKSKNEREV